MIRMILIATSLLPKNPTNPRTDLSISYHVSHTPLTTVHVYIMSVDETNRVVLEYLHGVDGSDYINASHIDSYHHRRAFIATQGPLQSTIGDFWRMVWQYNSPVVVMLTETMEKGMVRVCGGWVWVCVAIVVSNPPPL